MASLLNNRKLRFKCNLKKVGPDENKNLNCYNVDEFEFVTFGGHGLT